MQSNDARMLLHTAVPTAAVGVIAVAVSAVLAGGKGAVGAVFGTLVVILFMGVGLFVLQGTARKYPDLFQAMGLMLYTTQLLALFIFVAVFKDTTLFSAKAFAASLVVATLVWIAGQARAHMKAKTLYVEPEAGEQRKADSKGASA